MSVSNFYIFTKISDYLIKCTYFTHDTDQLNDLSDKIDKFEKELKEKFAEREKTLTDTIDELTESVTESEQEMTSGVAEHLNTLSQFKVKQVRLFSILKFYYSYRSIDNYRCMYMSP